MMSRTALLLIALLAIFSLQACGKKTLPVPPGTIRPSAITDLHGELDENGATLTWTEPRTAENGSRLKILNHYDILRAETHEGSYCQGCPTVYSHHARIKESSLSSGGNRKKISHVDPTLKSGYHYSYKVRSNAGLGITSDDSNIVSFWRTPFPEPPLSLEVTPGNHSLSLTWIPPASMSDGSQIAMPLAYVVYRSVNKADYFLIKEVPGTNFNDTTVDRDTKYFYKIRAVAHQEDSRTVGRFSNSAWGSPLDLSPPRIPRIVSVIETADGVKLFWEKIQENDLGGYRVYRRPTQDTEHVLLAETGADEMIYHDRQLPRQPKKLYYSLTSFDRENPPNESGFSQEKEITFD